MQPNERPPLIALEGDVKNLLVLLDLSDLAARCDEFIVSEILQRRRVDPRRLGSVALRAGTPSHESIARAGFRIGTQGSNPVTRPVA